MRECFPDHGHAYLRKRMPANFYVVLYGSCGSLYAAHAGVGREIQNKSYLRDSQQIDSVDIGLVCITGTLPI